MQANKNNHALYFLTPSFSILMIILFIPSLYTFYLCFLKSSGFQSSEPSFVGFQNFINLFYDREFRDSSKLLMIFIVATTSIELVIGLVCAMYVNEFTPQNKLLQTILILPLFVLPLVSGLSFRYLFDAESGVIASLFFNFGLEAPDFLGSHWGSFAIVVAQDVWRMWPFMFIIILAGLKNIPKDQMEAIKLDGASFWQQSIHVTLPALRNTILVAVALKVIESFKAFTEIFVMTGGGPGDSTTILPIFIVKQMTEFRDFSYGSAASYILLFASLGTIMIFHRFSQSKPA